MALRIIHMPLTDLFAAAPTNQNNAPQDAGVAFTGAVPGVPNPPAYLDPSHVAAWYVGYFTAQADAAEETVDLTMVRHLAAEYNVQEEN